MVKHKTRRKAIGHRHGSFFAVTGYSWPPPNYPHQSKAFLKGVLANHCPFKKAFVKLPCFWWGSFWRGVVRRWNMCKFISQVQVTSFSSRKFLTTSLPGFSGLLFWGGEGVFLITQSGCKMNRMENRCNIHSQSSWKHSIWGKWLFPFEVNLGLNFQWRFWLVSGRVKHQISQTWHP